MLQGLLRPTQVASTQNKLLSRYHIWSYFGMVELTKDNQYCIYKYLVEIYGMLIIVNILMLSRHSKVV